MRLLVYLLGVEPCTSAVPVSAGGNATPPELFRVDRLRSALTSVSQAGKHMSTAVAGKAEFSGAPETFHLFGRGYFELARRVRETAGHPQKIGLFEDRP
jgi:hypothetical protein